MTREPIVPSEDPQNTSKRIGGYLRYLNLGFEFFVAIGVFTFAGVWLDRKAGTTPLFTILGSILGFVAGFYMIYKELFLSGNRDGADSRHDRVEDGGQHAGEDSSGEDSSGEGKLGG